MPSLLWALSEQVCVMMASIASEVWVCGRLELPECLKLLEILEIYWNLISRLEILEIS